VNGEFNPNGLNRSEAEEIVAPSPIEITYGYSRDHRPDLKQFILGLIRTTRSLSYWAEDKLANHRLLFVEHLCAYLVQET
jgi:hypothetical protein